MGRIPEIVQKIFPQMVWRVKNGICLTFDDGPCPQNTPEILNILERYNVKAIFFLTGKNAQEHPEIVKEIYGSGHKIGSHGWSHRYMLFKSKNFLINEIISTNDLLGEITGVRVKLFRPPYGKTGWRLNSIVKENRLSQIMWSVSIRDYKNLIPDNLSRNFINLMKDKDIVLLHDRNKFGSRSIVKALPEMLDFVKNKSFNVVFPT